MPARDEITKAHDLLFNRFAERTFHYRPKHSQTNDHELDLLALAEALHHLITAVASMDSRIGGG